MARRTTTTTTTVSKEPLQDGSIKEKETIDKEITEKRTTIEDSPVREGNKETYRKTTITEKEEKIHKTQVGRILLLLPPERSVHCVDLPSFQYVRFTETNTPGAKERIQSLADRFHEPSDPADARNSPMITHVTSSNSPPAKRRSRSPIKTGSPLRSVASPRKSPLKTSPGRKSPVKSSSSSTPIVTSSLRTVDNYDEETFGVSGRKKRLAALAAKFSNYNDDDDAAATDEEESEDRPALDRNMSITKEIDVDEELAEIHDNAQAALSKARDDITKKISGRYSPSKASTLSKTPNQTKNMAKDPGFINSLKAQGFEESTSRSKLTYDFAHLSLIHI